MEDELKSKSNLISWARNLKEQLDCYMREYDEADKDLIADYNCRIRNAKELLALILEMLDETENKIAHLQAEYTDNSCSFAVKKARFELINDIVEIRKALEVLNGK